MWYTRNRASIRVRSALRGAPGRAIYRWAMARRLPFPLLVACCACFGRCCDGWELTLPGGCSAAPAGCIKDCTNGAITDRVLPFCAPTAHHSPVRSLAVMTSRPDS